MRLILLHYIAKMLRIQFKVGGTPFGAITNPGPEHSTSQRSQNSKTTIAA